MKEAKGTVPFASGCILNIQRFSSHDGPGIRTTVFMKGCLLSCWWCHNPESQARHIELVFSQAACLGCGLCVKCCPHTAISMSDGTPVIDQATCDYCRKCHKTCPSGALQQIGRLCTAEEVLAEVLKDRVFYEVSGGGVTFSGGEPLLQPEFLHEALSLCKAQGLHTAVDTSGLAPQAVLERISLATDLFLFDVKHTDSDEHRRLTGVPNDLILSNLRWLARAHKDIILRWPVVTGYNDRATNVARVRDLALELNIKEIHLLPYHEYARGKYERLKISTQMPSIRPPTPTHLEEVAKFLSHAGLQVTIGGE